jgi:hypothetical protein
MNKIKTTWNIIRENTGQTPPSSEITEINLETGSLDDITKTAYAFNDFILSIVASLNINLSDSNIAINLLKKSYPIEFTEMKVILITEGDIINTIKSLKPKNPYWL